MLTVSSTRWARAVVNTWEKTPGQLSPHLSFLSSPRRGGWGPEQHWTVTRVRRVLIPGLKAGVWQTSIHGTSKTNIGPSWRQGAHNGASRWKLCDAAPKSPDPDTEDLSVSTQLCHLLWLSLLSMPVFALWMSQAIENYIPLFCYFSLFSIIYPPR